MLLILRTGVMHIHTSLIKSLVPHAVLHVTGFYLDLLYLQAKRELRVITRSVIAYVRVPFYSQVDILYV